MGRTLLDKIWDAHTVRTEEGGRTVLYIDRQYIHEVTSPVAFAGLARRGVGVVHPDRITATVDHNIPTVDQHLPIAEPQSRHQVETLRANCARYGIEHFGMGDPRQGIVHIIGPELGLTQPGMTIVCGDSHTSTHGALGAVAFGVEPPKSKWYWPASASCKASRARCASPSTARCPRARRPRTSFSTSSRASPLRAEPTISSNSPARRSARSRWRDA